MAVKDRNLLRFSTGSTLLDLVVGGGLGMGYPAGNIINIVGDKSAGKTFLACEILAAANYAAKRDGRKIRWEYDDCESGFTHDTEHIYGVNLLHGGVGPDHVPPRSTTVEELSNHLREFLESLGKEETGIYIVDSLDGLTSEDGEERSDERFAAYQKGKDFDKGTYGMAKAKFMSSEFFPPVARALEKKSALLIIISQVRDNPDPLSFEKSKRGGGRALDFYSNTVLWLYHLQDTKIKERTVGVTIRAKAKKSKTPRPFREAQVSILFDYGLDDIGSNIDFLYDLRGKSGLLSGEQSKAIQWKSGPEQDLPALIAWLTKTGKLAECTEAVGGEKKLKRGKILEWLEAHPELSSSFQDEFGAVMSRAELIQYIEIHNLQGELRLRVIKKWEDIEDSLASNRTPKYGADPKVALNG